MCASCHSEVTVAGVGSFGVLEGFRDGGFQNSAAWTGSSASLAVFKQFSGAVRVLRARGKQGTWAPKLHFQSDTLFFLIGTLRRVSFEEWDPEPNSNHDNGDNHW